MFKGITALPTRTNMNAASPETAEYFAEDLTLYIIEHTDRGTRAVYSSFGRFEKFTLGSVHEFYHDQEGYQFGPHKIIGVRFPDGTTEGEIPSRKHKHWVAK